ncbi:MULTISPECIES: bifunctional riboflavin kinase/FAD synthetase [Anaerotignum]|uniref:bifunctional riboflavin kinase/FAD synthetase n=1 Tax=Anaerotignum TaxID=2039240 RepID=UPI002108A748|nr:MULTISPECIES: bifunctional riboflavin kinase/FAD synthetase [Anaerotignum]MCQ4936953.1 bifunctional riboflavin kinase/FAD synthetase [Anaerotignum propionicum]
MEHITDTHIDQNQPTAVTLGNFDGLHLGHRALIKLTKQFAEEEGLKSVVFTFSPHPMLVFGKKDDFALIMAPSEKKFTMEQMGIDTYIEYPFDQTFAAMSAEDFAIKLIFERMQCRVLIVGENYHFGANRSGDYEMLQRLGEARGVKVIAVPSVLFEEERVSSSRIRKCLIQKDLEEANRMLTEPYFILGTVSEGKKLGRTIGFPTINILAHPLKLFPPNGVYATKTLYKGKYYYGVTNIGINPTVNGTQKIVETYLLNFNENVYGETLQTFFYKFLRSERKFPGVEELRQQIKINAEQAAEYFASEEYLIKWKSAQE